MSGTIAPTASGIVLTPAGAGGTGATGSAGATGATGGTGATGATGATGGGGSPGGSNTQVQFNNSGAFGASGNFNWFTAPNAAGGTGLVVNNSIDADTYAYATAFSVVDYVAAPITVVQLYTKITATEEISGPSDGIFNFTTTIAGGGFEITTDTTSFEGEITGNNVTIPSAVGSAGYVSFGANSVVSAFLAGVAGQVFFSGTSAAALAAVYAKTPATVSGTVPINAGVFADSQAGFGALNAAFYAKDQGTNAGDWAYYAAGGNSKFVGTLSTTGYLVGATAGIDTTITTGNLVGKTITVTKGIITGFA